MLVLTTASMCSNSYTTQVLVIAHASTTQAAAPVPRAQRQQVLVSLHLIIKEYWRECCMH
jgi:hypothetical protein